MASRTAKNVVQGIGGMAILLNPEPQGSGLQVSSDAAHVIELSLSLSHTHTHKHSLTHSYTLIHTHTHKLVVYCHPGD